MYGPPRGVIDSLISQGFSGRLNAETACTQVAIVLYNLKPGERIVVERGSGDREPGQPIFSLITGGKVDLDAGRS